MGLVRKVINKKTKEVFACKLVKSGDEETIANIILEFKKIHKLNHPNVVKVYELYIDETKGYIYSIMEYIKASEMFCVI